MPISFTLPNYDKSEPFAIKHDHWNKVCTRIYQNRPLSTGPNPRANQLDHPWRLSVEWDEATNQFAASLNPGFVRGGNVEVNVPESFCGQKTLRRLELSGDSEDSVTAYLTERPRIPVNNWANVINADGLTQVPYTIPEWFHDQGVPRPKTLASVDDIQSGILFESGSGQSVAEEDKRLLKASDFTLKQFRPILEAIPVAGAAPSSVAIEVQVDYVFARDRNPLYVSQSITSAVPSD